MDRCKAKCCWFKKINENYCKRHQRRIDIFGHLYIVGRVNKDKYVYSCKNKKCENFIGIGDYCSKCARRIKYRGDPNITNPTSRKYHFNELLFENITDDVAWVLGWIASDGYINEKHYSLKLGITDLDIVEKIAKIFNYDGPIKKIDKNKYINNCIIGHRKPIHYICINSMTLCAYLNNLGIRQKKSLTIRYPSIDDKFMYPFLRGIIEGDGSIVYDTRKRLTVSINSGSLLFLEDIKKKVPLNSCTIFRPNKEKGVYRLCWVGSNAAQLCEKIYENCGECFLIKKKAKYDAYINERRGVSFQ